ncbi:MAG: CoA transferase, partial [Chloroflexi bacterium]|nr:CoA transferase [Chloroflexota bacterium]
DRLVEEWTVQHTPSEVTGTLQKSGVAAGPVMGVMDLMNDPHLNERDFIVEMDHPEVGLRRVAGLPARFGAIPKLAYSSAPLLGQHNQFVLGELIGIDQQRIGQLVNEKVIY